MSPADFPKSVPDAGHYEAQDAPWPEELRAFKAEKRLEIDFDDGKRCSLPAEYLRVESPSAEVQGHGIASKTHRSRPAQREDRGRRAGRQLRHPHHLRRCCTTPASFSWAYLRELSDTYDRRWATYLAALEARGLSRDP